MGAELSALSIADAVGASNEPPKRRRVYISVYTLFGDLTSNALLLSLTGGGLYHSGIEIEGVEYAFGGGPGGGSGVWRQPPRALPPGFSFKNSSYKESLDMGTTRPLTSAELHRTIVDMEHALSWRKNQYNVLTRNCHDFTAAACAQLGVAAPPEWLNALAQTAASGASAFGMMRSPSSPRPTERTDLLSVEI